MHHPEKDYEGKQDSEEIVDPNLLPPDLDEDDEDEDNDLEDDDLDLDDDDEEEVK